MWQEQSPSHYLYMFYTLYLVRKLIKQTKVEKNNKWQRTTALLPSLYAMLNSPDTSSSCLTSLILRLWAVLIFSSDLKRQWISIFLTECCLTRAYTKNIFTQMLVTSRTNCVLWGMADSQTGNQEKEEKPPCFADFSRVFHLFSYKQKTF